MKLYVPEIGDRLELTSDWTFKLYFESRNTKLLARFNHTYAWNQNSKNGIDVTLNKGVILKVDRVYIRQGMGDYSSISFYAEFPGESTKTGAFGKPTSARFWAKLSDCNNIEFEIKDLIAETKKTSLKWWTSKPIPKEGYVGDYVRNISYEAKDHISEMNAIYIGDTMEIAFFVRNCYTTRVIPANRNRAAFIVSEDGTCSTTHEANPNHYYHWNTENTNIKYELYDKNRKLIDTFSSHAKMKKFATEYYNNN
jgi:hypothetical protein